MKDSPASQDSIHHSDSDDDDEFRSHSFRERRLTYSRHHILSDTAATAVAELLAEGGDDFSDDNDAAVAGDGVDIDLQNNVNKKEEESPKKEEEQVSSSPEKEGDTIITTTVATTFHKRRRFSRSNSDDASSISSNNGKNHQSSFYLPSRILHAGEIVRRYSSNEKKQQPSAATAVGGKEDEVTTTTTQQQQAQHDVRTGVYSHPTHHATSKKYIHHYHGHGTDLQHTHHHRNKWRQRFSFCSTTPDHILPFPRHIVGTFSCHGMEPVYDSDYDDNNSDEDEEDNEQDNTNTSGSGNNNNNNTTNINNNNNNTSIAKINQDRGGIIYPYANSHNMALFAVYDGHGEGGELVSQFALGEVSRILGGRLVDGLKLGSSRDKKMELKEEEEVQEGERKKKKRRRRGGMLDSVQEEDDCTNVNNDGQHNANNNNNNNDDEEFNIIEQSFKETFLKVDRGLLNEEEIEPMYSGTTACVVLKRHQKLYIANCGDSRAVLARRHRGCDESSSSRSDGVVDQQGEEKEQQQSSSSSFVTIPLSIDQNPDSPGEKERILNSGGYVSPPPEPGLTARVWLDPNMTQIGLAMARSIGDHAVKSVGVIAEPVVSVHTVDEELDEFVIIATDGVWEFISSEDAVDIVGRCLYNNNTNDGEKRKEDRCDGGGGSGDASEACEALIKAATAKWHEFEGDYRDDITAMVIRLKDLW